MSSNKTNADEPSGGGKGIFIALVPWIVFTVLAAHSTLKLGSLAALAAAVVIAGPGVRAGRPKLLEVGAVVTFIGFVAVAFLADASTAHWVARYARGIAAAILALISFASLFFTPFTEQYARDHVPEQHWGSPKFKEVNRKLTTSGRASSPPWCRFTRSRARSTPSPATSSFTGRSHWGWSSGASSAPPHPPRAMRGPCRRLPKGGTVTVREGGTGSTNSRDSIRLGRMRVLLSGA